MAAASEKQLSFEEELELELETFELDGTDDENDGEKPSGVHGEDMLADTISVTTNSLLRATICELERALKDTRRLLFQRDKDNTNLRQELEKTRKELRREQALRKRVQEETEEKLKGYNGIYNEKEQLQSEVEQLKGKIKTLESDRGAADEDTDEIIPCCSSMNELVQVKQKLWEIERQFQEFRENNRIPRDALTLPLVGKPLTKPVSSRAQPELQTELRLKFLRDAFFFYMIDFYPDEQMRAILAILDYEDKRKDIITESHSLRRQGKKFTVTEVSSRSLTFVQENT